jgi:hypothetical protein
MRHRLPALLFSVAFAATTTHAATPIAERLVRPLAFAAGQSDAEVKGQLQGRRYVDHTVRAGAGQTMAVSLTASNAATQFNVIAPGAGNVAMFADGGGERRFEAMLPTDGAFVVRVYLVRAAARRAERSDYTLRVAVTGTPLKALPASADALVKGSRFHATTTVPCRPAYAEGVRECQAGVVRRGAAGEGTATVVLRWPRGGLRQLLFVKGQAVASDAMAAPVAERQGDATRVRFGTDEQFEIPDALVSGG